MIKTFYYKCLEFFVLFVVLPISFVVGTSPIVKTVTGLVGFLYVVYVLLVVEKEKFRLAKNLKWILFWRDTLLKFSVIVALTTIFVNVTDKESLFNVVLNKPKLWVFILFVYSLLSVYPQEIIFRTFFFKRYARFFRDKRLLILVNAVLFSLAHLFYGNNFVLLITFLGGLLFAWTYVETKSTIMVSIEHAIYGCWLFTVGMGEILGFPT
ncbi:CPBP family intramembrane glutamic endopeptidase [Hyunsoonleella rubra]|uniref:CPBP family intramembrane glutamic endopeptidase n=1 Tax=Hyunsoonleella rubra TaxID=1737062 RepID=A0ABW5TAU2_9FLAO